MMHKHAQSIMGTWPIYKKKKKKKKKNTSYNWSKQKKTFIW